MSDPQPARLVTPRPDTKGAATKRSLMDAARRLFAARGYISSAVPDIAAEAGKSPATFYKYFANKQDMLEALLSEFLACFDERVAVPQDEQLSNLDRVRAAVRVFWSMYREFRAEWIAITQAAAVDAEMVRLWLRIRDRGIRRIAPLVRAAQDSGALRGEDPEVVASNLSGMIEHTAYLWLGLEADGLGRPSSDDEAVETLALSWHRALGKFSPSDADAQDG